MPLTKAEAITRHTDKAKAEQDLEDERNGVVRPSNDCPHPVEKRVRGLLYKGTRPLQITHCEACGANGPATGAPTLANWVSPTFYRQ